MEREWGNPSRGYPWMLLFGSWNAKGKQVLFRCRSASSICNALRCSGIWKDDTVVPAPGAARRDGLSVPVVRRWHSSVCCLSTNRFFFAFDKPVIRARELRGRLEGILGITRLSDSTGPP